MSTTEEKSLFAIASEKLNKRTQTWEPCLTHVHAFDAANAKVIFLSDPQHAYRHRIIAVGPVIGYHVEDEHGERLLA